MDKLFKEIKTMVKGQLIDDLFEEYREAPYKSREQEVIQKYSQLLGLQEEEIIEIIKKKIQREKNKNNNNAHNGFNAQLFWQLKRNFILALSQKLDEARVPSDDDLFGRYYPTKIRIWREKAILDMLFYLSEIGRGKFTPDLRYNILEVNPEEKLAILQVIYYGQMWNGKTIVRKNYYLLGLTEKNRIFTHSITGKQAWSILRHNSCDHEWQPIINKLLFGVKRVIRQGEIGFIPESPLMRDYMAKVVNEKGKEEERRYGSHLVKGKFYFKYIEKPKRRKKFFHRELLSDKYYITYVLDPIAIHERNQHDPLHLKGVFKLVKAYKAREWDFSEGVRD